MTTLKLWAFDPEDLAILSAHLQDAVVRAADMAFLPREQRFAAIFNRFDWTAAVEPQGARGRYNRLRSALRFERVRSAQLQGFAQGDAKRVLDLLAITFEPAKPGQPDGLVTLAFADGCSIRLDVECLEAEMSDLGPSWRARSRPDHPDTEPEPGT